MIKTGATRKGAPGFTALLSFPILNSKSKDSLFRLEPYSVTLHCNRRKINLPGVLVFIGKVMYNKYTKRFCGALCRPHRPLPD